MQRYVVSFYWGALGEEFFSVGIFVSEARSPLIDDAKVALSRWPRAAGEKFFPVEPKAMKARIATALWVDFILYAAWLFIVQSFNAAKIGGFAFTGGAGKNIFTRNPDRPAGSSRDSRRDFSRTRTRTHVLLLSFTHARTHRNLFSPAAPAQAETSIFASTIKRISNLKNKRI